MWWQHVNLQQYCCMLYVLGLQRDEVGHYTEVGQASADEFSQALASRLGGSGLSPSPCHKQK